MTTNSLSDLTTSQDVIELTLGRAVITETGEHDRLVHLCWRLAAEADHVVQVYLNDELVDVGHDVSHPQLWLVVDRSREHRIELLAVPRDTPADWWTPQPERLTSWAPKFQSHTRVRLLRDEALPIDTQVQVRRDGDVVAEGPMWPSNVPRSGFGGLFGVGTFGRDTAAGPGLGRGQLGYGPLGTDAGAWYSPPIPLLPGENQFTIHTIDATGQEIVPPVSLPPVTNDSLPEPAHGLTVHSDFTLAWNP